MIARRSTNSFIVIDLSLNSLSLGILLILINLFATLTGCSMTGDLTRPSAQKMIEGSEQFRTPITIPLEDVDDYQVQPKSADEKEEEAQARALEMYLSDNRMIAVLRHLAYVEVRVTLVKPFQVKGSGLSASISPWIFRIEHSLGEKGKQAAKSQAVDTDKAVVIARREVVEITGIRKEGVKAIADFTWKTIPTDAGRAFDPTTDTFKTLPQDLQESLTQSRGIGPFGNSATVNWAEIHKGIASFQKYDDGWRLTSIRL